MLFNSESVRETFYIVVDHSEMSNEKKVEREKVKERKRKEGKIILAFGAANFE